MKIKVKRVYESPHRNDGARILVDRLWPRGLKKDAAQITTWARAVAPSDALRRWFHHDPKQWKKFQQRYRAERARLDALDSGLALVISAIGAFHKCIARCRGARR